MQDTFKKNTDLTKKNFLIGWDTRVRGAFNKLYPLEVFSFFPFFHSFRHEKTQQKQQEVHELMGPVCDHYI